MKIYVIAFLSLILLTGFNSSNQKNTIIMNADENQLRDTTEFIFKKYNEGITFYAVGNEPYWNLDIGKDKFFRLNMLNGISINLGPVTGEKAMDANIKRYVAKTDYGMVTATIYEEKCTDNMSGENFKYKVIIEFNNPSDNNYKKLEGCGRYVPDYSLNRKWILKKLGDSLVNSFIYVRGLPEINFDVEKERFSGFSGCNRIMGGLYAEDGIIRFGNSASTLMACDNIIMEKEFNAALGKAVNYKISDGQLILSNPDEVLLEFYDPEYIPTPFDSTININRLYDIWVLESLNGIDADPKNYMKEIPRLELNTAEMRFTGSSGCNNINGKIYVLENSIKFSDIASTRMMCPGNSETDFLNALKSVNVWKVENMKLYLSLDGNDIIVLKKID